MSVINQVLRDLDKRQQNAQGARIRSHYQPASGRPWLWVGTLSAAIVVSAALTWWLVAHALTADEAVTVSSADSTYEDSSFTQSVQAPLQPTQLAADDDADTINEQPEVAVVQPNQVTVSAEPAVAPRTSAEVEQVSAQPVQVAPAAVPSHSAPSSTTNDEQTARSENAPVQQAPEVEQSAPNQPNQTAQAEESRGEMSVQRVERSATELAAQRLDQAVGAMESGEGRKAESLLRN